MKARNKSRGYVSRKIAASRAVFSGMPKKRMTFSSSEGRIWDQESDRRLLWGEYDLKTSSCAEYCFAGVGAGDSSGCRCRVMWWSFLLDRRTELFSSGIRHVRLLCPTTGSGLATGSKGSDSVPGTACSGYPTAGARLVPGAVATAWES
jgi:hypothetical protein